MLLLLQTMAAHPPQALTVGRHRHHLALNQALAHQCPHPPAPALSPHHQVLRSRQVHQSLHHPVLRNPHHQTRQAPRQRPHLVMSARFPKNSALCSGMTPLRLRLRAPQSGSISWTQCDHICCTCTYAPASLHAEQCQSTCIEGQQSTCYGTRSASAHWPMRLCRCLASPLYSMRSSALAHCRHPLACHGEVTL